MKGLILINAYSKLEHSLHQSERLKDEFFKLGVDADIVRNDGFFCVINEDGEISSKISGYDFCVYLDKDKYVSEMLEKIGLRLYNRHAAIRACDDKMKTHILLSGNNVKMPLTAPGLLCYDDDAEIKPQTVETLEKLFGYPIIVKGSYGSMGQSVFKADCRAGLLELMERLKRKAHLFQKCVTSSIGKDMRIIVIGGRARAAMLRESKSDFRSNIELGASGIAVEPAPDFERAAEAAARVLGLDFCGVDVLFGENGEPIVCEVNSNAFFGGIEAATGKNIAREYAEYILSDLKEKR